jgi:hypothetical protein
MDNTGNDGTSPNAQSTIEELRLSNSALVNGRENVARSKLTATYSFLICQKISANQPRANAMCPCLNHSYALFLQYGREKTTRRKKSKIRNVPENYVGIRKISSFC